MADANNNDSKFEKLTPILEYTYVVLYNMLNTTRSIKNYIDAYARDMDLKDLEQYNAAVKALDQAIRGLTESAKNVGAIYGLPEDMLHPEKMMQELGEQIKRMQESGSLPQTSAPSSAAAPSSTPTQSAAPATQPTAPAQPTATSTSNAAVATVSTVRAPNAPETTQPATASSTAKPAASQPAQANAASATQTQSDANAKTSGADDNDEIQKILEQLKALRNNQ